MSRRRFLAAVAGVSATLAAPSILRAQSPANIKIATGVTPPSIHNIYMHVAYERGMFRENGINVTDLLQLRGGPLATQAVSSGQVDVTASDPEGVLSAAVAGHPIRAVSAPASRLSYMIAVRKEIGSVADLRGKPFAVSRPGAISQYLMFPMLETAKVPRDAIQWVSVGGGRERMLALLADRVKGALLHIDYAMEAAADPNVKLMVSVADVIPNYPFEVLILRNELLEKNPAAATAITRAVIQACRYIVRNKSGTVEVMMKYSPSSKPEVVERAYDELLRIRGFGVNGDMTEANMTVAHDLALQHKQINQAVPMAKWLDFGPQERAMTALGRLA